MKTCHPILACGIMLLALSSCQRDRNARSKKQPVDRTHWQSITPDFPPPICEGTPWSIPKLPVSINPRPTSAPLAHGPPGCINLALGKPVTSSDSEPITGDLSLINDGDIMVGEGHYVELMDGAQWVTIDLGKGSSIYVIWIWHRAAQDNNVYFDVVAEISDDPNFRSGVTQVYNNDYDNSLGMGKGRNSPYIGSMYGKCIQLQGAKARYIRLHSNGSGRNGMNHYVEVEVYGLP